MKSILDVNVSRFNSYSETENPTTINLIDWLKSDERKSEVMVIRGIEEKKKRDALKSKLPAITPSGIFTRRLQDALISHSGLMQFDIDLTEVNKHISNWDDLKKQIFKIRNVAYVGLSASGKGYWGIIPISNPKEHIAHFNAMEKAFLKMGINIDTMPKSVASLRGYSFDADAYFRHDAEVFTGMIKNEVKKPVKTSQPYQNSDGLLNWIIKKMNSAPDGQRHEARLKFAKLCGGHIAAGTLDQSAEQSLIDAYLSEFGNFDNTTIQAKEIKAIRDGIKIGLQQPINENNYNKQTSKKNQWEKHINALKPIRSGITVSEQKRPKLLSPQQDDSETPKPIQYDWSSEIAELETFFSGITPPTTPIKINPHTTIEDVSKFVSSHIATLKANNGKTSFLPYLSRLKELKQIILFKIQLTFKCLNESRLIIMPTVETAVPM